jgi:predicted phosphodiesterase
MRVAVISDIHANCVALDAVLSDLQQHPADELVCLGDAVQGGPQPVEVVSHLRELACPVVMGNADAWLLSGEDTGHGPATEERERILAAVRDWSLTRLSPEDLAFIRGFQPTVAVDLEARRTLLCFHGSPASFDDVMLPDTPQATLFKFLGQYSADALTGGHTHVQYVRRLAADERFLFNPGSVGRAFSANQPADDIRMDPWAEYAVLTSDGRRLALDFRRVPYDVNRLLDAYRASGRPYTDLALHEYSRR